MAVPLFPDSVSIAVMVALPAAIPVTLPEASTVAIPCADEDQWMAEGATRTMLSPASLPVALSDVDAPTATEGSLGEIASELIVLISSSVMDVGALAATCTFSEPRDCAAPVPSVLGYAVAVTVMSAAGTALKVTVLL